MSDSKLTRSVDAPLASSSPSPSTKRRSASYPAYTLEQAEELAKIVFALGARKCDQEKVAQSANYSPTSGAFRSLRASANHFGLLQLEKNSYLSVSDDWIDVFHSEDPKLLKEARRKALLQPKLYKLLIEEYDSRQLPTLEKLSRELHLNQKYGILKDAAETAARIFLESARYAGSLSDKGYLVDLSEGEYESSSVDIEEKGLEASKDTECKTTYLESTQQKTPEKLQQKAPEQNDKSADFTGSNLEDLEKHEIRLINGQKAYLYVPVPLPYGEKERLKKYLSFISDLILEAPPPSTSTQQSADTMTSDLWASEEQLPD